MSDPSNVHAALHRLVAGDAAAFVDLLADDVTWTIRGTTSWSACHRGRREVLLVLRSVSALFEGGWRATLERVISGSSGSSTGSTADERFVVAELRGANQLRDGRRYDNQYCWILRVRDGAIREVIEYGDTELIERVLPPLPPGP